jgi:hypothetical protein
MTELIDDLAEHFRYAVNLNIEMSSPWKEMKLHPLIFFYTIALLCFAIFILWG